MAMVFFLTADGGTKVALDIESTVNISLPSMVAKSSTMSGVSTTDDVIEGNAVITVQGLVTYSKLAHQEDNLNPIEFQEAIQTARRNRQRFTLYVRDDGQPLLSDYTDCVISNATYAIDRFSDTITVNIVFEQVFISEAARATYLAPVKSSDSSPTTSSTSDSGDGTKTKVEEEKSTLILSLVNTLTGG